MVYLEPSADVASGFEVRVMKPGCDCFFTTVDYNGDGRED